MYGNKFSVDFFKMKLQNKFNLMYSKVVKLQKLYLVAKDHFQIHRLDFEKK